MGRFIGRRPDPTPRVARSVRGLLEPDEEVIAGIYLNTPRLAVEDDEEADGSPGFFTGIEDEEHARWEDEADRALAWWTKQAERFGIDHEQSGRVISAVLVLTPSRLVLVRRTLIAKRPHKLIATWPVPEIDRIRVPRDGMSLRLWRGDAELMFALPNDHRFLPDVYRNFPDLLVRAQEQALRQRR